MRRRSPASAGRITGSGLPEARRRGRSRDSERTAREERERARCIGGLSPSRGPAACSRGSAGIFWSSRSKAAGREPSAEASRSQVEATYRAALSSASAFRCSEASWASHHAWTAGAHVSTEGLFLYGGGGGGGHWDVRSRDLVPALRLSELRAAHQVRAARRPAFYMLYM